MIRTIDLKRFNAAVGFIPTFRVGWGNTRKANIARVELNSLPGATATALTDPQESLPGELSQLAQDADRKAKEDKAKKRMQLKKQLIVSKEYDAIKSFMGEIRNWVYKNTVPSFFKEGFQLVGLDGVEIIEKKMRQAIGAVEVSMDVETLPKLVEAFLAVYPAQIEEARKVLEPVGQFDPLDYPTIDEMRGMFNILWNWVSFSVPEGLPAELREAEANKMEKQFSDAGEEIKLALRAGFAELVNHLKDRLTVEPGQKAKVFRDSAMGNITDFIETFNQRNLTNDVELAQLVGRAREILLNITPQKLRDLGDVKAKVTTGLSDITAELDKMIVEKPGRKFDLDEEPAAAAA